MKSDRNKTIDLSVEEGERYLERCLRFEDTGEASPSPDSAGAEEGSCEGPSDGGPAAGNLSLDAVVNRTILGDCFQVMPQLPTAFVDLMIADPPYNMAKDFHGTRQKKMKEEEYEEFTERWISAALPLLKEDASIYVCCDWQTSSSLERVLKRHFHVRNRITWQREKGRGALSNWKNGMEDIWFATRSENYTFHVERVMQRRRVVAPYRVNGKPKDWVETEEGKFRNTHPSNFWDDISIPYWSMAENTAHPAQKPEKLLAKLILSGTEPGGLVFDPFLGSGSTSVTAKKLGRRYLGIEQNPLYCVWAEKRLEMADRDRTIQGYADGVFWERNTASLQKNKEYEQLSFFGLTGPEI